MFYRRALDKLFIVIIGVIILVVISYHPRYHLRNDMPPGFFKPTAESENTKHSLEQRIAWGYWESAVMDIQWKYTRGRALPPEPPPEFHLSAQALGPTASDPATRSLYWHRLQEAWFQPGTWTSSYEWDWGWASDPLASAGSWLRYQADRLFTISR